MENGPNQYQYTVIMTELCNLACSYCYVTNKEVPSTIISEASIDAIIALMKKRLSEGWAQIKLDIFGGEPLIAWPRVQYFIQQIEEQILKNNPGSVVATIFTNATMLNMEVLEFTVTRSFVRYNFSVDGNRNCHDENRIYRNGRGSYDDVMQGIELYCKVYGKPMSEVSMMFMLAPSNIGRHFEIMKDIEARGMPLYYTGLVRENVWKDKDLAVYKDVMSQCMDYFIERFDRTGFLNTYFLYPVLDMRIKRNSFCGACKGSVGVSPNGDLYPCQRFYNNRSGYKIGTVHTDVDRKNGINQALCNFTTGMIPTCKKCKYGMNPGCMGQCIASCYESSKNIFKPIDEVCQLHRINLDLSERLFNSLSGHPRFESLVNGIQGEGCGG